MDREDRLGKAALTENIRVSVEMLGGGSGIGEMSWENLPEHTREIWKKTALAVLRENERQEKTDRVSLVEGEHVLSVDRVLKRASQTGHSLLVIIEATVVCSTSAELPAGTKVFRVFDFWNPVMSAELGQVYHFLESEYVKPYGEWLQKALSLMQFLVVAKDQFDWCVKNNYKFIDMQDRSLDVSGILLYARCRTKELRSRPNEKVLAVSWERVQEDKK